MMEYAQRLHGKASAMFWLRSRRFDWARVVRRPRRRAERRRCSARVGRLAAGAYADIVSLDKSSPFLVGREGDQILDAWIFCAGNRAVDCVWSAGRKLVTRGRHFSREDIGAKFAAAMRTLILR